MTLLVEEQKHNRPPQEFIDARSDILNDVAKYMDFQTSSFLEEGQEIHEFRIDGDSQSYLFMNLDNGDMVQTLKDKKPDLESWVNKKAYNIAATILLHETI